MSLNLHLGPMFSGKSKELISVHNKSKKEGHKVYVLQPKVNFRDGGFISTRDESFDDIEAEVYNTEYDDSKDQEDANKIADEFYKKAVSYDKILIDEIQFFKNKKFLENLIKLSENRVKVNAYGLNMDFEGNIWPSVECLCDSLIKSKKSNNIKQLLAQDEVFKRGIQNNPNKEDIYNISSQPGEMSSLITLGNKSKNKDNVIIENNENIYVPMTLENWFIHFVYYNKKTPNIAGIIKWYTKYMKNPKRVSDFLFNLAEFSKGKNKLYSIVSRGKTVEDKQIKNLELISK